MEIRKARRVPRKLVSRVHGSALIELRKSNALMLRSIYERRANIHDYLSSEHELLHTDSKVIKNLECEHCGHILGAHTNDEYALMHPYDVACVGCSSTLPEEHGFCTLLQSQLLHLVLDSGPEHIKYKINAVQQYNNYNAKVLNAIRRNPANEKTLELGFLCISCGHAVQVHPATTRMKLRCTKCTCELSRAEVIAQAYAAL